MVIIIAMGVEFPIFLFYIRFLSLLSPSIVLEQKRVRLG